MSGKPKQRIRTIIKVDTKALSKHFRRLAEGNRIHSHPEIIQEVISCIYAIKGNEKRSITPQEASQFIKTGTITVK